MFTIKTLNAISPVGLAKLNKNLFDVSVDADAPDGILVRSADLLNTTFNDNLLAIARAGAGVNNIPLDRCSEQGIVVFNTPGANANAVAELVIGMLIAGSRNVAAAAQWTQGLAGDPAMAKSVEKGKKQFVGNEIKGKTLGVIGLGAIGSRVANCAIELGMEVYGYDPYISIDAAWNLSSQVHHCVNLNDMLPLCDYITIHVPYLPTTKDTINTQTLALCKDGVKLLNYARGELVNTDALLEALDTGKVSGYMTDFPTETLLGRPGVICTPHLGASTPEAEDNCAVMAADELKDYLENGNTLIYGNDGAERELLLNAIIYSTFKNYTSEEVNMYIVDYGSESLRVFQDLPQMGNMVFMGEDEKFNNLLKMIRNELQYRKKLFINYLSVLKKFSITVFYNITIIRHKVNAAGRMMSDKLKRAAKVRCAFERNEVL